MTSEHRESAHQKPFAVAILSGKGGVGKTTISLSLARQLSRLYPVWLVDIDLFNRGTTSAIWESEKSIPLSVAELIRFMACAEVSSSESATETVEEKLKEHAHDLLYSDHLWVLPAARAKEGREASFILWHRMTEGSLPVEGFCDLVLQSLQNITPGCLVIFDGHGGLDDLSIGAALASDVTLIVNEPDLITFTGSITLAREINDASQGLKREPLIEFIVNRVPPNKSIASMELDFGDALHSISPSPQPVVAYFPLEPELFGVFGDDPFVSEIFTEYWFSKKIRLLTRHLVTRAQALGRDAVPDAQAGKISSGREEALRTSLKRAFHKRGDRLLIAWLTLSVATLWILLSRAGDALALAPSTFLRFRTELLTSGDLLSFLKGVDWPILICLLIGQVLLVETSRWLSVQWRHVSNARKVKARHGRWRRLGESASTLLREKSETAAERRGLLQGLISGALAIVATTSVLTVLIVPNLRDADRSNDRNRELRSLALGPLANNATLGNGKSIKAKGILASICRDDVGTYDECHSEYPTGCSASGQYDAYLNLLKNQLVLRTVAPIAFLTQANFQELEDSTPTALDKNNHEQAKDSLAALGEGKVFGVMGFLYSVQKGAKESANCQLTESADTNFQIGIGFDSKLAARINAREALTADELAKMRTSRILVEVTPHWRARFAPGWTLDRFAAASGRQVRIVGQLLMNNLHFHISDDCGMKDAHSTCWRASAWELHPVTRFEVCVSEVCTVEGGNWVDISDWGLPPATAPP